MAGRTSVGNKNMIRGLKPGRPRRSKKNRGNKPARTSRRGNGKRIR
jgi:hypothetical protein